MLKSWIVFAFSSFILFLFQTFPLRLPLPLLSFFKMLLTFFDYQQDPTRQSERNEPTNLLVPVSNNANNHQNRYVHPFEGQKN